MANLSSLPYLQVSYLSLPHRLIFSIQYLLFHWMPGNEKSSVLGDGHVVLPVLEGLKRVLIPG